MSSVCKCVLRQSYAVLLVFKYNYLCSLQIITVTSLQRRRFPSGPWIWTRPAVRSVGSNLLVSETKLSSRWKISDPMKIVTSHPHLKYTVHKSSAAAEAQPWTAFNAIQSRLPSSIFWKVSGKDVRERGKRKGREDSGWGDTSRPNLGKITGVWRGLADPAAAGRIIWQTGIFMFTLYQLLWRCNEQEHK